MSAPGAVARTAVTGWAWRTPLGSTIDEALARLCAGERAARENPRFDPDGYACTHVAAIAVEPKRSRHQRFLRRMGLFAVEAAGEALARSGACGGDRLGLFCGIGGLRAHWNDMMHALERVTPDGLGAWERGLKQLHPFWMLQHLSNNAHALLSVDLDARGEGVTFGGANAGAQALAAAARALASGAIDAALVVGADSLIEPETLVELAERGAAACGAPGAPYDRGARGFVPGEAAAALVLEPVERAGARALCFVQAVDGADGEPGAPRAATLAHAAARLCGAADGPLVLTDGGSPIRGGGDRHEPLFVDGAALGQPALDLAEREALAPLVGARAPLIATAAATGQLGAAGAPAQVIALGELLRRGLLPPIAGLTHPAPGPLSPVTAVRRTGARAALGLGAGAPGLVGVVRVSL